MEERDYLSVYKLLYQERDLNKPNKPTPILIRLILVIIFVPLCLMFPHISLLFFLLWKNDKPKLSKWIAAGTFVGFALNFGFFVLSVIWSRRF